MKYIFNRTYVIVILSVVMLVCKYITGDNFDGYYRMVWYMTMSILYVTMIQRLLMHVSYDISKIDKVNSIDELPNNIIYAISIVVAIITMAIYYIYNFIYYSLSV